MINLIIVCVTVIIAIVAIGFFGIILFSVFNAFRREHGKPCLFCGEHWPCECTKHEKTEVTVTQKPTNIRGVAFNSRRNPMYIGNVFLLLKDGRLTGPFRSKEDARYWANSQDIKAFSTYDMIPPHKIFEGQVDEKH